MNYCNKRQKQKGKKEKKSNKRKPITINKIRRNERGKKIDEIEALEIKKKQEGKRKKNGGALKRQDRYSCYLHLLWLGQEKCFFLFYIQINKYFFEDNTVIQAKVSILEPET